MIETIQTTGLAILFYGALPYLTIINGLVVSIALYILPTFWKCIWNCFQLKNQLTTCNNETWKVVFHFALVILQGGAIILYIILFSRTDEWKHWTLFLLLVSGVTFTLFGWWKICLIIKEMKSFDIPNNIYSHNAFIQCIAAICRIIVFSIVILVVSIKLERISGFTDLFVIFRGKNNVFDSTTVSRYNDTLNLQIWYN